MDLGMWKYVALFFIGLYFCLAVLFPIFIMFWASLIPFYQAPSFEALPVVSFSSYRDLLGDAEVAKAVRNTAWLMLESAGVTTLLATTIAWVVLRSKFPGRRMLDVLTFSPPRCPERRSSLGPGLRVPDLRFHPDLRHVVDNTRSLRYEIPSLQHADAERRNYPDSQGT
jgi:ABC-type spermidine/putrescine transport system permease subunit II